MIYKRYFFNELKKPYQINLESVQSKNDLISLKKSPKFESYRMHKSFLEDSPTTPQQNVVWAYIR